MGKINLSHSIHNYKTQYNIYRWHAGECYTFGCRITYHCGDGYELVGKQASDCQADGYWLPKELPTCVCK